jgi:hypothetical protein
MQERTPEQVAEIKENWKQQAREREASTIKDMMEVVKMLPRNAKFYQVIGRNNDPSGNPYRLVLFYSLGGGIVAAAEARSSSPNICVYLNSMSRDLYQRPDGKKWPKLAQLPGFHMTPVAYNDYKKYLSVDVKHVD